MEAPGSPREESPASIPVPITTHLPSNHKKRKHGAVAASVAASSPAPSDRGNTPAPENIVIHSRHVDLTSRPRLTISRHPSFVPIAPGSLYHSTEPLCINRLNYRYTPAGLSALGSALPFRTIESAPPTFRVSWEDRSPFVKVTQDGLGLRGEMGFRSARCNAPVRQGKWYMEVKIELGGGEKSSESKRKEGSHVRLGWARREAPLNAPAGLDGYSYAVRDKTGEKVHISRPKPYGKPFKSGDVVGMYISLPSPRKKPNPRDPNDPRHVKRERIAIEFKGQEYFESLEYSQTKEMLALMDSNDRNKTSTSTPAHSSKKSATVKNIPSTGRGKSGVSEPAPLRPLPTLGPDSCVAFFVNGECQGIAFQDLYDYIPLKSQHKVQEKKRHHKEGHREHKENPFDDGSLGYYPFISLFNEARVKINPGPDFDFPPPPDIDAVLSGNVPDDVKPNLSGDSRTWRPICDRYPEYMSEQFALDDKEETEAKKAQKERDESEKTDTEKLDKHRDKRKQQTNARKEREKKKKEEDSEMSGREDKRRKVEAGAGLGFGPLAGLDRSTDIDTKPSRLSQIDAILVDEAAMSPGMDHAPSPAPTVASSVDVHMWNAGVNDASEYNTEYEDNEEVTGDGQPLEENQDTDFDDELAAAAGVDRMDT
ncbi:Protein SSH4 [Abortiporus biennis]